MAKSPRMINLIISCGNVRTLIRKTHKLNKEIMPQNSIVINLNLILMKIQGTPLNYDPGREKIKHGTFTCCTDACKQIF